MLKYSKYFGYTYLDENTLDEYGLYRLISYDGTRTLDKLIIWDEERDDIHTWIYGETLLPKSAPELETVIAHEIERAAQNKREREPEEINTYNFDKLGVNGFLGDSLEDVFEAIDNGHNVPDIQITVGEQKIAVPTCAQIWEAFERFMHDALEEWEEE